ncbi:hypothetical protein ACERIT_02985 [Halopenitus sp. H-Gu1]|uniref:hypothetical protein n=1 Tax=Halopenitus sp. H-Gu1 TaxID=3242697 RepID=UPI00359E511C
MAEEPPSEACQLTETVSLSQLAVDGVKSLDVPALTIASIGVVWIRSLVEIAELKLKTDQGLKVLVIPIID